jgi:hypothetical protein
MLPIPIPYLDNRKNNASTQPLGVLRSWGRPDFAANLTRATPMRMAFACGDTRASAGLFIGSKVTGDSIIKFQDFQSLIEFPKESMLLMKLGNSINFDGPRPLASSARARPRFLTQPRLCTSPWPGPKYHSYELYSAARGQALHSPRHHATRSPTTGPHCMHGTTFWGTQ